MSDATRMWRIGLLCALWVLPIRTNGEEVPTTASPDYGALSGRWEGMESALQRGRCTVNHGARSNRWVRLTLDVAGDGSFVGTLVLSSSAKSGRELRGQFTAPEELEAKVSMAATCGGQALSYSITLSGKISKEKGRYRLELEGDDPACPDMKCIFRQTLKLQKK